MVQVTLNFRLQLFKKKNVICLSLGFFKLLNKREERSNNVGKTVVILSCVVSTYRYDAFDCMFLPCQMVVKFWLNGWVFVFELSGRGFESSCSHLNFRFCACFEQGVPWHSGNYREWIHSETRMWHDKNIQYNHILFSN